MDSSIISALIAATISIMVSLIAYFQAHKEWRKERELLERQLQRALTEKLYDLRLSNYPKAFEITEGLRSERLFSGTLQAQEILSIRNNLISWANQNSFYLSEPAIQAYYDLRRALNLKTESVTRSEAHKIFETKKKFRGVLRADINLLYAEEQETEG